MIGPWRCPKCGDHGAAVNFCAMCGGTGDLDGLGPCHICAGFGELGACDACDHVGPRDWFRPFRYAVREEPWPTFGPIQLCPVCGKDWRPYAGSRLLCHAECLLTEPELEALNHPRVFIDREAERLGLARSTVYMANRAHLERRRRALVRLAAAMRAMRRVTAVVALAAALHCQTRRPLTNRERLAFLRTAEAIGWRPGGAGASVPFPRM